MGMNNRQRNQPIRRLGEAHRRSVVEHLQQLPESDLRLRFGHGSKSVVEDYASSFDFRRDAVLGAVDSEGRLLGLAHVPIRDGVAELGVSVLPCARGRGLGLALSRVAHAWAHRAGARRFHFLFAAENRPMYRIAETMEMSICRDGSELLASADGGDQAPRASTSSSEPIPA
jgi:GNAT superfamily N-acetyltransferase